MAQRITGTVVAINDWGDLITDITAAQLVGVPTDERVAIHCDGHETIGILPRDHGEPPSTLVAVIGSGGQLEIGIVDVSIHDMLGIGLGTKVLVKWID